MSTSNLIENKLIDLEGGKFQRLCNEILNRLGYGTVTNSGGKDGTDKTVKGTPDSYIFREDGTFVFMEYTAQQTNVFVKFKKDINKCLDESKTGVSTEKIEKIVLMFNSSLTVGKVNILQELCKKKNVKFEKFDINRITDILSSKLPFLAKDYLGIAIDYGQFLDYETFVERNDKAALSTPLNLDIVGRDNEMKDIHKKLDENDFLVVSGKTGIGKTKLVIESLQCYKNDNKEYNVWFVKDRGQGLYEELLRYTAIGKHIIFVDDINKQTSLGELLEYFSENSNRIKVIATVREYALELSINTISKYALPNVYKIEELAEETIVEILKNDFEIHNQDYHKRILNVSKGNIRLAVMMATIANKENTLDSISNIGLLLEQYYIFMDEKLKGYDEDNLKALAALTFFDKLHLESDISMKIIESITGINSDRLKKIYQELYNDEVVDIYEGEIVALTDQIVGVFIFHYVYEVNKILEYNDVIEKLFPEQKKKIIQNINGVTAYYNNIDFFIESVKGLMSLWSEKKDSRYRELLLDFWFVKPDDTLILIIEEIGRMSLNQTLIKDYFYDRNVNNIEYDQLLNTLGQFSNSEDVTKAIKIALKYLMKDYSKVREVSKMLIEYFGYNIYSHRQGYQIQKILIESITSKIKGSEDNPALLQLFCNIATHLLQFETEYTESSNDRSITIHTIVIQDFREMNAIRNHIWTTCEELIQNKNGHSYILKLLHKYGNGRNRSDVISLYELDFVRLQENILPKIDLSVLECCVILNSIEKRFVRVIDKEFSFLEYKKTKSYDLYCLIKSKPFDVADEWEEGKKILNQKYISFAKEMSKEQYVDLIYDCIAIDSIDDEKHFNAEVLEIIILNTKNYFLALDAYIDGDTPFNINPLSLISMMIKQRGYTETWQYIESKEFTQKEYWKYLFFSLATDKDITRDLCTDMLYYFKTTDKVCSGYYRRLDFLEKWIRIDNQIVRKVVEIIYQKQDEYINKIYFFNMFRDEDLTDKLIKNLNGDLDLLEGLYLCAFSNNGICDPKGTICRKMIKIIPSIFWKVLEILCSDKSKNNRDYNGFFDYSILWECDDNLFELFEYIMSLSDNFTFNKRIEPFLFDSSTTNYEEQKKENLVRYIKKYADNEDKMRRLFYTLAKYDDERRIFYYNEFVKQNKDIEAFKKLPLNKVSELWSNSDIPRIVNKQTIINSLINNFSSFELLYHRRYLKEVFEGLEKYKKDVRIRERLREY